MKVRKSLSRPLVTLSSKKNKKPAPAPEKAPKIRKQKNSVGTVYPPENLVVPDLDIEKAAHAADLVLKEVSKDDEKPTLLGGDEGVPVWLTMSFFRIPDMPTRILRFELPHTLLQETTDVAMIVRDLEKKERHPDHDIVAQMYQSRLRAHGIKHPIQIFPIRQIMTEYKTYESRRKLCNSFDVFLADITLTGRLIPLLGHHFTKLKKNPIPVRTEPLELMIKSINQALNKTVVQFQAKGNCRSIKIGHTNMTAEQIAENVKVALEKVCREFPGGWMNVRNMHLKSLHSRSIPFYFALRNPNDVKITHMKRKIKHDKAAIGELTTAEFDDLQVRVQPDGEIDFVDSEGKSLPKKRRLEVLHEFQLRKRKFAIEDFKVMDEGKEDEDDEDVGERELPDDLNSDMDMDPNDDDEEEEAAKKKTKGSKKKPVEESDDEEETAVLNYEDAYLNELEHETEEQEKAEKANEVTKKGKAGKAEKVKKGPKKGKKVAKESDDDDDEAATLGYEEAYLNELEQEPEEPKPRKTRAKKASVATQPEKPAAKKKVVKKVAKAEPAKAAKTVPSKAAKTVPDKAAKTVPAMATRATKKPAEVKEKVKPKKAAATKKAEPVPAEKPQKKKVGKVVPEDTATGAKKKAKPAPAGPVRQGRSKKL